MVLLRAGGGDGAVFDGFARAGRAGVGCERRCGRGRGDIRGQPRVGAPLDPARRETGSLAPRKQTKFRSRVLAGQEHAAGRADHRAAGCDVGGAAGRPADHGGAQHAVVGNRSVGIDGQKKPYTPTNSVALTSRPRGAGGARRCRSTMPRQYVFVDESGVTTDLFRRYARSPRGTRIADHTPCGHWQTHTVVAALRPTELTATAVFDGPIDTATFRAYVEQVLVPTLRPGDVVVLDNLAAHKQPEVRAAIEQAGRCCDFFRPTAPTSIRSNWPSPN